MPALRNAVGATAIRRKDAGRNDEGRIDASPDWQTLPPDTPLIIQNLLLRCFQRDVSQRLQNAKDAQRVIAEAITRNRFAPLLYLKTWFWKIDRKTKTAFALAALALVTILALKYTAVGDLVFPAKRTSSSLARMISR